MQIYFEIKHPFPHKLVHINLTNSQNNNSATAVNILPEDFRLCQLKNSFYKTA